MRVKLVDQMRMDELNLSEENDEAQTTINNGDVFSLAQEYQSYGRF